MNAVIEIAGHWLQRGLALARSVGPYALIEILLPGGTLIALLLWLSRRGAFVQRFHPCNSTTPPCITRFSGISSIASMPLPSISSLRISLSRATQ